MLELGGVNNTFPGLCWTWEAKPTVLTEVVDVVNVEDGDVEEGINIVAETEGPVWTVRIEGWGWLWDACSVEVPSSVMLSLGWHWGMAATPVLLFPVTPPACC